MSAYTPKKPDGAPYICSPEYYAAARKKGQIKGNIERGARRRAHKAMAEIISNMEQQRHEDEEGS